MYKYKNKKILHLKDNITDVPIDFQGSLTNLKYSKKKNSKIYHLFTV